MSRGCLEWETSENRWREERKKKAKEPGSEIVIELKKKRDLCGYRREEGRHEAWAGSGVAPSLTDTRAYCSRETGPESETLQAERPSSPSNSNVSCQSIPGPQGTENK